MAGRKEVATEFHLNCGHDSAKQSGRAPAYADRGSQGSLECDDEVSGQCEVSRAFEKALHPPAVGASFASSLIRELGVNLPFLDDAIARRAVDLYSKYPLLAQARSGNPVEAGDAISGARIAVCGRPGDFRMDEEGGWENGICTVLRMGRNFQPQSDGGGVRPRPLGRRCGLASGIDDRSAADGRSPFGQFLTKFSFAWTPS